MGRRLTMTAEQRALLAGDLNVHVRILVRRADGTWIDLSAYSGTDWFVKGQLQWTIDDPVATATITLLREDGAGISLAPQMSASAANRDGGGLYNPLVSAGNQIRVLAATVRPGIDPNEDLTPTDPGLESGGSSWTLESGWAVGTTSPHSGANALAHTGGLADAAARNARQVPCVPGDDFLVTGWVKNGSADGRGFARICWLDSSHVEIGTSDDATVYPADGVYHLSSVLGVAPAGTAYARAEFCVHSQTTGTWYADDLTMARGAWKRLFDGKIDSTDPGGDEGLLVVGARDRGAWIQDTFIEVKRTYAATATAVETIMAQIITDNAVPGAPAISTPTSPGWILTQYEQSQVATMEALRDLVLQIGWDFRYFFTADGDVDPTLLFYQPPRTASSPDWEFGPNEYFEIPTAKIDDADVRNAVTINYRDTGGNPQTTTRTNSASISQFGRRWMGVTESDASNIDTSTEADTMGDALVDDLGEPQLTHQMLTAFFWAAQLNDVAQFDANNVHYDQAQVLAIVGITHDFEAGHAQTTLDCRGKPAGAYHEWLELAGAPAAGGAVPLTITPQEISRTSTTITLRMNATAPGSSRQPAVALLWTGIAPPVSRLSGGTPGTLEPNASDWTFTRPVNGTGDSLCGFLATLAGYLDTIIQVPIPEAPPGAVATVSTPSITVNPDPSDSFDIAWGSSGGGAGAQYRLYWRSGADGTTYHMVDYSTIGTATSYTVPHGGDFFHIIDSGSGGSARTFECYVEMYDSGGTYLAQSAIGSAIWQDDGLG